jgi:hypothetical protein
LGDGEIDPLRNVVWFVGMPLSVGAYLRTPELFSCGYAQPPVLGAFGETMAGRRRCRSCAAGLTARLQELAKLAKPGDSCGTRIHGNPATP